MAALKKYLGVYYNSRAIGVKKWRAQIVRRGITLGLGCFVGPDDAARAYDNASHHLAEWGEQIARLNFPEIDVGPMTEATRHALGILKERFPNWEEELKADAGLTECEKAEKEAMFALDEVTRLLPKLRYGYNWAFSIMKAQEVTIAQLTEQVVQRDRVIEGLKAAGNAVAFKPVVIETKSVEQQLS